MFNAIFELSTLNGKNGFVMNGVSAGDTSGHSVSSAGDVNDDGITDVIIGAPGASPGLRSAAGANYVVFGSSNGFNSPFELSTLNGNNGFVLDGVHAGDNSGNAVSAAGDVNDDGIADVIIGALMVNSNPISGPGEGASYVVFGKSTEFTSPFELSTLNGFNGFVMSCVVSGECEATGWSVGSAGDINADGIADIIIGAPDDSNGYNYYAGASYVVFGSKNIFNSSFDLSTLNGNNGFVINGAVMEEGSGISVSAAGDVNGDGISDLIIGAPGANPDFRGGAGASYVVFGSSNGFNSPFELSALNGTNGFVINGVSAQDISGSSVSIAGDVNGDGISDLIIGAPGAGPGLRSAAGASYVVFGSRNGFNSSFELSALNGTNGFVMNGVSAGDSSGSSVSTAGDINDDGMDDVIVGAYLASPPGRTWAGASYVVFGSKNGFNSSLELSTLNGANGFVINGVSMDDRSGMSVSAADDVNDDGIADVMIGAQYASPDGIRLSAGVSYVIYGQSSVGFFAHHETVGKNFAPVEQPAMKLGM